MKAAPQPLHDIALLLAAAFLQHREAVFQRNPRRQQRGKAARKCVDVEARRAPQPEAPGFSCRLTEGADHDQPLPPQPAARRGIVGGIDRDLFPDSPGSQDGITQFRHCYTPAAMRSSSASVVIPCSTLLCPSSSSGIMPLRRAISLISPLGRFATIAPRNSSSIRSSS